uniref:Uncharacterized protein n=1 Tax=Myripristis murdjan TaxID=586833 RepID=A0A667ZD67_9TELE
MSHKHTLTLHVKWVKIRWLLSNRELLKVCVCVCVLTWPTCSDQTNCVFAENRGQMKVFLPNKLLECLPRSSSLPNERLRWNTNEVRCLTYHRFFVFPPPKQGPNWFQTGSR